MKKILLTSILSLPLFVASTVYADSTESVDTVVTVNKTDSKGCPFTLGAICFQPALGALWTKRSGESDYKDLRLAAIVHERIYEGNMHSFNMMVVPGEKFIDSVGIGYSYGLIKLEKGFAVLNVGFAAKRFSESEDVRGGAYLMMSYSL